MPALLLIAMLCSAIGFTVQWREQWLPNPPTAESITWQDDRSAWHNLKNLTTETVRADAEWWSKLFCFVILVQFVLLIVMAYRR